MNFFGILGGVVLCSLLCGCTSQFLFGQDDSNDDFSSSMVSCDWESPVGNVSFDLSQLAASTDSEASYVVETKGDLSSYSYVWNICNRVTRASVPVACEHKMGAAIYQYHGFDTCNVLGKYKNTATFSLLDNSNPAKGVTIVYSKGI
jgi:hypothetical protein